MSPTGSWSSKPTNEGTGAPPPDARIELWLHRLLETPGLTAIRDPAEARRVHLDESLALVPFVSRYEGPIVDVGSGGGAPGVPLAAALPDREVVLLEATRRKSTSSRRSGGFPNARVVCGRAEDQPPDSYGVAVAKALAPPPVALEWCLPLVAGGAAILLVGPSADAAAVARVSERLGGGQPELHAGSSWYRSSRPRRRAFRGGRGRAQAPARVGRGRPPAKKECSGGWAGLRSREPEGWGREDDDRRQPRRLSRRGGREGARHRPRPAGERDLRARRARERDVQLRPARRRAAREL